MNKFAAYILSIICVLSLIGCSGSADKPIAIYIGDDVTEIKITHILGGQLTEWSIEDDDISLLQTWVNGLDYKSITFEEGNTPGDSNGGEIYWFELTGGDYSDFDYIITGPDDCYLLIEGRWYVVRNPSAPPVEAP